MSVGVSSGDDVRQRSRLFVLFVIGIGAVGACTVGTIGEFTENRGGEGAGPGTGGYGCGEEVCDGFDNDCDGQVDEDCPCDPGDAQYCYSGNPITVGIGNCQRGEQDCESSGFWGACVDETKPANEECDTFDNDCDGLVDEECPCDEGETQSCYTGNPITAGIGACRTGTQSCADGTWDPICVGSVGPSTEICNGADDDCDGYTDLDDLPADLLCPIVPNGVADCVGNQCVVAGCDTDYVDVNGIYNDGCECLADPSTSEGAQCTSAIDLGQLSDVAQSVQNQLGNGGPAGRSLWYVFQAADDVDTAGDEFHVDVRFMVNPGDGYAMDVYRAGCSAGNRIAQGEVSTFDWFTDFARTSTGCTQAAPCGEGDCVASPGPGQNSCQDNTALFYVRIYKLDGAASCDGFTLELSNGVR